MSKRRNWVAWWLAAGVVAGTTQVALRYQAWKRKALARLKAGAQIADTAAGPIEYATIGEGPAVLVLHGSPGGYDQGLAFARIAGPEGYRYIAPSRPGYLGTSITVGATPAGQADACAALLDSLEVPRATVIGISGGGPAALQFALRHADRCAGLVMACAVARRWLSTDQSAGNQMMDQVFMSDPAVWAFTRLVAAQGKRLASLFADDFPEFPSHIAPDPEKLGLFLDFMDTLAPASPRRAGFENDYVEFGSLPLYPLERVAAPTLVLHGTRDHSVAFADAEFVAHAVPGAELHAVQGGDHVFFIAHKHEVREVLMAFLGRCAGS